VTQDQDAAPAQHSADFRPAAPAPYPEDFQPYVDSRFGFAIAMPKRFEILPDTIDPLARMMRGLHELSEAEAAERQARLPMGFFDPEVLGDLGDGDMQPLRLFEYEAIRGRDEPLSEEQSQQMWLDIQGFMPETLASGQMPGYEFLGTRETTLGELPALAFEYGWDGVRPGHFGGDHACIVWALGPMTMYHVYHHCSGDEWETRLPEFEAILATFEVFEPMQGGGEAAGGAPERTAPQGAGEAP
jgi:hypothetical protein